MGLELFVEGRLSYPMLDEPQDYQGNKKFRWGAVFAVPKEIKGANGKMIANPQIAIVDQAIRDVAKETWNTKAKNWEKILPEVLLDKKGCCWVDGGRKAKNPQDEFWMLTAYRYLKNGRPLVYDSNMEPIYKPDNSIFPGKAGRLYPGVWVKGKVELWAQDDTSGNGFGMRCGLLVVQRLRDGDSFGGGSVPTSEGFGAIEEGADADDISA